MAPKSQGQLAPRGWGGGRVWTGSSAVCPWAACCPSQVQFLHLASSKGESQRVPRRPTSPRGEERWRLHMAEAPSFPQRLGCLRTCPRRRPPCPVPSSPTLSFLHALLLHTRTAGKAHGQRPRRPLDTRSPVRGGSDAYDVQPGSPQGQARGRLLEQELGAPGLTTRFYTGSREKPAGGAWGGHGVPEHVGTAAGDPCTLRVQPVPSGRIDRRGQAPGEVAVVET